MTKRRQFHKGDKRAWGARRTDDAAFQDSLERMATVLAGGESIFPPHDSTDQLWKALEMIGHRERIRFQLDGRTAASTEERVQRICHVSKIRFRQVSLKGDWRTEPACSLLAFKRSNGDPVALIPDRYRRYRMFDPTEGTMQALDHPLAQEVSPTAYAFFSPMATSKKPLVSALRLCFQGHGADLARILLTGATVALLGLAYPLANKLVFDHVIPHRDYSLLSQVVLGLGLAALASFAYLVVRDSIVLRLRGVCENRLQGALWDRLLRLPLGFFREYGTGEIAQRVSVIEEFRDLLADQSLRTLLAGAFSTVYLVAMFYYSWQLTFIGLLVVGSSLLITVGCAWLNLPLKRQILAIDGKINEALIQLVNGVGKLRVAGAEKRVFAYWAKRFAVGERLQLSVGGVQNVAEVTRSVMPIVGVLVIYAAAMQFFESDPSANGSAAGISIGSFLAFQAAFGPFAYAVAELGGVIASGFDLAPYWERSRIVFEHPTEEGTDKRYPGRLEGEVDVRNVFFRYHADRPFTLYDISLNAKPGEFIAIVGPSGCGKSTLLRLLLGFERPEKGSIYYDRQDLWQMDVGDLRRQFGVVLQTSAIFAGTIYENLICGGRQRAGVVESAIRSSTFNEVLGELPMGLDTVLPSGGGTLSGGQRQRLLICRALVRQPKILLLDEATSALDNHTQARIIQHLDQLEVTRIVIAHRLSTIQHAHRIYVMERGRMLDCGTYAELARRSALFKSFADRQAL